MKNRYTYKKKIGGRYIVHKILKGGMGELYLCHDNKDNSPIALKTFQSRFSKNPRLVAAFKNEINIWIGLEKHPNVVRCFYADIIDNQPFMFLEWVVGDDNRGSDLRSWLNSGALDLKFALTIAIDICEGLAHAGKKRPGIIHRDLKPENILINQRRNALITDFGLSKIIEDTDSLPTTMSIEAVNRKRTVIYNSVVGTPHYMAPEQWKGEKLDFRTDIYAVGCIFYEMLTWLTPFDGITIEELKYMHCEAPIPKIKEKLAIDGSFDSFLAKAMAKEMHDRFGTIKELSNELLELHKKCFGKIPERHSYCKSLEGTDYYLRGRTYFLIDLYDKAISDFHKAIKLDLNDIMAYIGLGAVFHKQGKYEEALAQYDKALELDHNLATAYDLKGSAYSEINDYSKSLENLNKAILLDPLHVTAFINRGAVLTMMNRNEEAIADFQNALKIKPNNVDALLNIGSIHEKLNDYDKALDYYNQAIEIAPTVPEAYGYRAQIYKKLNLPQNAIEDYTNAIQFNRNELLAYTGRGSLYMELQQYQKALEDYDSAIKIEPNYKYYQIRGNIHIELKLFDEALKDLNCSLQLEPNAKTYISRGALYSHLERFVESINDFDSAIQLDSNNITAYLNRGEIFRRLNRYEEAIQDFNSALKINPSDARAFAKIGLVYANQENWVFAKDNFYQAINYDDMCEEAYFGLGLCFLNDEMSEDALYQFLIAAQLGHIDSVKLVDQISQELGIGSKIHSLKSLTQVGLDALIKAKSLNETRFVLKKYPFIKKTEFLFTIERIIAYQTLRETKDELEMRLIWIREIISENGHNTGF